MQMPEVEAVVTGETGILFERECAELTSAIEQWFALGQDRESTRRACYQVVDEKFNPETQRQVFASTFRYLMSTTRRSKN